jgi:5-methylcytosine-specific restriction protein A
VARRPKTLCRQAGCGALIEKPGFCERHQKARQQDDAARRGTAHERGYTSAWTKARGHYLAKHPLCALCALADRVVAATVVDHIVPHRIKDALDSGDVERIAKAQHLFWDSAGNWQPLCKPHHDAKTAREDGGFGRARAGPG